MKIFEVEQKYRLTDPRKIRKLLRKLKAHKLAFGKERNEYFDRKGMLRRKKTALRLRQYAGREILTLKGPRLKSKYTKRMEVETVVDYENARAILKLLGFRRIAKYAKKREEYSIGSCLVCLDKPPGRKWFLEIEGSSGKIDRLATRLGLRRKDREKRSYFKMLFGSRRFKSD